MELNRKEADIEDESMVNEVKTENNFTGSRMT